MSSDRYEMLGLSQLLGALPWNGPPVAVAKRFITSWCVRGRRPAITKVEDREKPTRKLWLIRISMQGQNQPCSSIKHEYAVASECLAITFKGKAL